MKMFLKHKNLLLTVLLVFVVMVFSGSTGTVDKNQVKRPQYVSAFPDPIDIQQPDGSILTIQKVGDEVINYTRSIDGFTLLQDESGFYHYATLDDNGDLVISSRRAENPDNRSNLANRFLSRIEKNLTYSDLQRLEKKEKWELTKAEGDISGAKFGPIDDAFPSTGTRNMLVILANFTDKSFVKTNSNFNSIMNVGGSSFKAYYQDNSYNNLTVNTTVVGPYNINMSMSAADSNTRDYISRCVTAANNDGVNFANYDNDSDGTMDALYVIHAGYGEEAGAPSYTIWSHSWDLGSYALTYDGVYISSYATSPELRGASGSTITSIGVICHEFGHNIGVPDYYDTNGSTGGTAWDLKSWDVMAGGSWNNGGDTPAQHNMYTKWKLGWVSPTTLSSDGSYSLRATGSYSDAYRINTTTSNEFFILENRQQSGWDSYIGGHGMLIFHIDGAMIDSLSSNTVNATSTHQGVDIEEADNVRSSSTYGGDPFPGTGNKTSFTDTTTPSAKSWASADTDQPITDISESSGVVYFDYAEESGGGGGGDWSGYYRFMNRYSGYAMDVNSGSNYVYHYTYNGNTDKHWEIIDLGTGYFRIDNRYSGYSLDTGSGNYVYQYTWNGNTDKHWNIIDLGTGYYRIDNRASGYSLDTGSGSYVYHYTWNGNTDKQWQIISIN